LTYYFASIFLRQKGPFFILGTPPFDFEGAFKRITSFYLYSGSPAPHGSACHLGSKAFFLEGLLTQPPRGGAKNRLKNNAKTLRSCADIGSNSTLDEFWRKTRNPISNFIQNTSSVELEPISAQERNVLAVFLNNHGGAYL